MRRRSLALAAALALAGTLTAGTPVAAGSGDPGPRSAEIPPDMVGPITTVCRGVSLEGPRGTVRFAGYASGGPCDFLSTVICHRYNRRGQLLRSWPVQRTYRLAEDQVMGWRIRCGRPTRTDASGYSIHGVGVWPS